MPRLHFGSVRTLRSMSLANLAEKRTFLPSNLWLSPTTSHTVVLIGFGNGVCFVCAVNKGAIQYAPAMPTNVMVFRLIIGNLLRENRAAPYHSTPSLDGSAGPTRNRTSGLTSPVRRQTRSYMLFRAKGKPASLNFFSQSLFFDAPRSKEHEKHNSNASRTDSY